MSRPVFAAACTVVGSFPHTDAERLVDCLIARLPDVPAWPQLPARDWRESMYVQYSEHLPGAVVDAETRRIFFRVGRDFEQQLEVFYRALVDENVEHFAISRDYALGLHLFLEKVRQLGHARPRWIKGQVTGPFSFAMTVTDEGKRSLAYTPELREVAVQGMAMKARWLARRLREVGEQVLVVIDEPYLCSFGSAFVNVAREDVTAALEATADAIHAEGALAGLHCCGNTDWSLVLATGIDVLNFDAYQFFHGLPLYPTEVSAFLETGGTLAWGIVPTSNVIETTTATDLLGMFDERVEQLADKGIDRARLRAQALLTPSCGLGTQSVGVAERVLDTLVELGALVRGREGA